MKRLDLITGPTMIESCSACPISGCGGGKPYCIIIKEYNNNPGTIHINCKLRDWVSSWPISNRILKECLELLLDSPTATQKNHIARRIAMFAGIKLEER